jgi:hypothetical protein
VLQLQFTERFPTPVDAAWLTFLGPLIGSLIRPVGGHLADRLGGARVTFWNFVAMAAGASLVLFAARERSFGLYLLGFLSLFVFSGIGNGSTYKMIPAIFRARATAVVDGGRRALGRADDRGADRHRRRGRGLRRGAGERRLPAVVPHPGQRGRGVCRLRRGLRCLFRGDLVGLPAAGSAQAGRGVTRAMTPPQVRPGGTPF